MLDRMISCKKAKIHILFLHFFIDGMKIKKITFTLTSCIAYHKECVSSHNIKRNLIIFAYKRSFMDCKSHAIDKDMKCAINFITFLDVNIGFWLLKSSNCLGGRRFPLLQPRIRTMSL